VLGGPGDNYDVYKYSWPDTVVRRQPLVYSPRSTARHNYGLLPRIPDMAGMELAYRHQSAGDAEMTDFVPNAVSRIFLASLVIPATVIVPGYYFGEWSLLYLAPAVSTFAMIRLLLIQRASPRNLLLAIVLPAVAIVLAMAFSALFMHRLRGAVVCSATTFVLVTRFGIAPFRFYLEWLYTHPRLRPETRRSLPALPAPDYLLLLTVLATAAFVPMVSTTAALAVITVLCLFCLWRARLSPLRLYTEGARVLTPFLLYGGPDACAPGVWQGSGNYRRRGRTVKFLLAPLFLTLAASLNFFMPLADMATWNLAQAWAEPGAGPGLSASLRDSPVGWIAEMVDECRRTGWSIYFYFVPIAIAVGVLLPPTLLVAVFRAPLAATERARLAIEGAAELDTEVRLDDDSRPEWQWYVDRIQDSPHAAPGPLGETIREADHLFLGVEPHVRFPVLLHEKILAEHAYFVGDSGSGKTSLGLMPLLMQLIRGHGPSPEDLRDGRVFADGRTLPPPIVVIDLKGDPALFHTVKAEAEARKLEFRFFTPEKGRPSHYFNPFASIDAENRTEIQLCHILLDALSLNHGEGYGRGYYSRQSRSLLYAALTGQKKPRSLEELREAIDDLRKSGNAEYKDTLELVSTLDALINYKMLAVRTNPRRPDEAIHMPSVLERRQVVYFWLPAVVESVSAREIAKLALYSLLTACIDRQRNLPPKEWRQAYVFIDEFQRIAGENFRIIMEQARSFGLGVVLANQSVADLVTPDVDLRPTVRTNTRFKRYFSVTDPHDVASLSEASGQELMYPRTWSQTAGDAPYSEHISNFYMSRSDSQSLKPRLTSNDILAISDHPLDSILHVSRGSGYTQFAGLPIPVRCTWPMSRADYDARRFAPWPTQEEFPDGTTTSNDASPHEIDRARNIAASLEAQARMQTILAQRT
jgi:hypothetical protein